MMINDARALAATIYNTPDGKQLIDYIVQEVCGVHEPISTMSDLQMSTAVGRHNVGIEIMNMVKEPSR